MVARLTSLFGILALVLASIGITGPFLLIAHSEYYLACPSFGAGKALGSQLNGTNQNDRMVLSAAGFTLRYRLLLAAFIPAYKGSSISPMQALRADELHVLSQELASATLNLRKPFLISQLFNTSKYAIREKAGVGQLPWRSYRQQTTLRPT